MPVEENVGHVLMLKVVGLSRLKGGDIIGMFLQPDVGLGGVVSLNVLISCQQCHETTKVCDKCIRRPSRCLSFIMTLSLIHI